MRKGILVLLKFPEPGKVKTRLAEGIGAEAATVAYRQMVCRVLEQCRLARPEFLAIAFSPGERESEMRRWLEPWLEACPHPVHWIVQEGADLGERLERAVSASWNEEKDLALAVIGTDCVGLDVPLFEETWQKLEEGTDVIYGPAPDGGYYLVGLSAPRPELFRAIPWSAPDTLTVSLETAQREGLRVSLLPERIDVDTESDWAVVAAELSNRTCVFFDRDGVVNRSPGAGYVLEEDAFHLQTGIGEALRLIKDRGGLAIVVTSQKGVGKGLMDESTLKGIHRKMQSELLRDFGVAFDGIYAYTGEPSCRHLPKPNPEMILSACERYFIDPRRSWMIGDADRDIRMGKAAGLKGTIRIVGEKPIGEEADFTLNTVSEITNLLKNIL